MEPKPLVIYHANCADGFGAAWCFHHNSSGSFDFHPGVYQDPPPNVVGREVYLVDFSYKSPVLAEMAKVAKNITILDHHKTAIEDITSWLETEYNREIHCCIFHRLDLYHSGAMLAWNYLFTGVPPPPLIRYIEDRDLWKFHLGSTREINAALFSYEYDFEIWDELMLRRTMDSLIQEGKTIERKHFKDIGELLRVCERRVWICGYEVPMASIPYTMSSDAGHTMAMDSPFAACYIDTETHRIFSLRSRETGIDVSEIAKKFGGGGHKHAAGFKVPRNHTLAQI